MHSLELVLDYALSRMNSLEGKDRLAFASEYKEWLATDKIKEKVWFSISLKNTSETN